MIARSLVSVGLALVLCFGADWDPQLAARYLDSRQQAWFAWPLANREHGAPCLSCHTGLTYLLARPALRKAIGQSEPTSYEQGLLDAIRRRIPLDTPSRFGPDMKEPLASQVLGVEAILSALLLAAEDERRGKLSKDTEAAFDRMWRLQIIEGDAKGSWHWNSLSLDPWEEPDSAFFGASLAALAAGVAPSNYQKRAEIRAGREMLAAYLNKRQRTQPLHNRLMLVWASMRLRSLLPAGHRKEIVDEALRRQRQDGSWEMAALGPWKQRPNAPESSGSNAYATGLTAHLLQQGGVSATSPAIQRALAWLRAKQDLEAGFWDAPSMNKKYSPGSMPLHFMRDAATAFASLALIGTH
jgi:squalene-hopene/tetraprenyl-beta-curcumene cyclase